MGPRDILNHFVEEGKVIRQAPVAFIATIIIGGLIAQQYYANQIEALQADVTRLRRALEIEEDTETTPLIDLTDAELKQKGTLIYQKIRQMNSFYQKNIRELENKCDKQEIDSTKFEELEKEQTALAAEEFNKQIQTDALMVRKALQSRIPYEHRKHIPGLPDLKPADPRAGSVSLYGAFPSPFNLFFSEQLANELEELVKLLPD